MTGYMYNIASDDKEADTDLSRDVEIEEARINVVCRDRVGGYRYLPQ